MHSQVLMQQLRRRMRQNKAFILYFGAVVRGSREASPQFFKVVQSMVLELQGKKGKKYNVYVSGKLYCRCYPKDLRELGFAAGSEGQEIEAEEAVLEVFERAILLPRAKRRALLLLGKKEYTRQEMEKKLLEDGYPATVTEAVLTYLEELHYVEDTSYAERYALYLLPRCSEREVYQRLQQKGLEKDLIQDAIKSAKEAYRLECGDDEAVPELAAIRTLLRKKGYQPELADREKQRKMVMSLYRKGFSLSDIRTVIGEFETETEF